MLYSILEEAKGAIIKVQQHAHTISLGVGATTSSIHEPAIGAVNTQVVSFGIKVGPADADADAKIYRKRLHFPVVLALR
jgi:hypothetical protein